MNFFRKHQVLWKIIIFIATLSLITFSLLPLFASM